MNEARPVCDIETPRKERNAGIGILFIVFNEPKFVAHGWRVARHFLGL